jgi:lysozyme
VSLPVPTVGEKHISVRGLHLIEGFEGFGSCPYWDPYGRVWTRGYGETEGIGGNSPCVSRAQGENNLRYLVEARYEWALRGLGVSLNQNQWDALCSFVWNLGAGIFTGGLRADLQSRQFYAASRIMLQYDHAGGQVLEGLRRRRQEEMALFLTPIAEPSKRKHSRAYLLHTRAALRADLTRRHCRVKPYGRGKYHGLCKHWKALGNQINAELKRS